MNRPVATALLVAMALYLAGSARAERLGRGSSLVLVGIDGHTGGFLLPGGPFRLIADEVGGELAYCRFLSDIWTLGLSGSYHVGGLRLAQNNPNGTPAYTDKIDTHSFTVRLGTDRFSFINNNVALYAGPGLFLTRGQAKEELTAAPPAVGGTAKSPYTTELGLNGRIGMYGRVVKRMALFGHIGHVLSHTSANDSGDHAKVSWWSSTFEGATGLAVDF